MSRETNPQNYVEKLTDIDGKDLFCWQAFSDEMYTWDFPATTAATVPALANANMVEVIVNGGHVYMSLESAISSVPGTPTKSTFRLLNNQTDNYIYFDSSVTTLYFYNSAASASGISVVFGRTENQLKDKGTAGRPAGDFG